MNLLMYWDCLICTIGWKFGGIRAMVLMSMSHDPRDVASVPAHFSAWCKVQLGWASMIDVTESELVSIPTIETSPIVYRMWEDGYALNRYFLLEVREKKGFDTVLPFHRLDTDISCR